MQRSRINRDLVLSEVITVVIITITTAGAIETQTREMLCLPLDYLNEWVLEKYRQPTRWQLTGLLPYLFGIVATRVKKTFVTI